MRGNARAAGKRPNDLHGKSRGSSEAVVDAAGQFFVSGKMSFPVESLFANQLP
jgi:hypothetical protein